MADEMERMSTSDIAAAGDRTTREQTPVKPETTTSLGTGRAGAQPEISDNRASMNDTTMKSDMTTKREMETKAEDEEVTLLSEQFLSSHREKWTGIQTKFVDDPRQAVEEADGLVAEVIHELASRFSEQKKTLESKWHSGADVSTEDLRVALRMYRAFFQRLMSA